MFFGCNGLKLFKLKLKAAAGFKNDLIFSSTTNGVFSPKADIRIFSIV